MALTPGRWLALFAVGACAIVAAVVGVRASTQDLFLQYYRNEYGSRNASGAQELASAVHVLQRRDSLVTAWRKGPSRPGLEVVFAPRIQAQTRQVLDSVARAFWAEHTRGPALGRTVLVFSSDTTTRYRGIAILPTDRYVWTPEQTDGRTCAVFLQVGPNLLASPRTDYGRERTLRAILARNAGPCFWLASYGPPGRALGQWLLAQNYIPSLSVPGSALDAVRPNSLQRRSHTTAATISSVWSRDGLGVAATACLAGRAGPCREMWGTPLGTDRRVAWLPHGFVPLERWWVGGPVGGLSTRFIAALESDLGPEKFARLWSSDAPLDRAFTEVAGDDLAGVTRRILLADFGELQSTPWPSAIEWAIQLLVIALGLAATFLLTRRKAARA